MAIFTDDFERANGALGGNWVNASSTATISGGSVVGTTFWQTYNTTIYSTGRLEVSCHFFYGGSNSFYSGVVVKQQGLANSGFYLGLESVASNPTVHIREGGRPSGQSLASASCGFNPGPFVKLTLIYEDGHLSGYVNDTLVIELDSGSYGDGVYAGLAGYSNTGPIADFRAVGGAAVGLSVSPDIIPNFGECSTVTLTGTNTSWTTGTPGSPTFTVNHGTISAQEVTSSTTATLTYCPGDWLGPVVFTDPSTGNTAGAVVTSNPNYLPGDQCPFDEGFVALANRSDSGSGTDTLITTETQVEHSTGFWDFLIAWKNLNKAQATMLGSDPDAWSGTGLIYTLWQLINGLEPHSAGYDLLTRIGVVKADTQATAQDMTELRTIEGYSLQDVVDLIRGTELVSNTDLMGAINDLPDPQAGNILDAISAARGTPEADIRSVVTNLDGLRTINDWTLGNVKTWIEAIEAGSTDLTPVLTAISDLSGQLTTATTNIRNDIAGLGLVLTALELSVGTIGGAVDGVVDTAGDILTIVTNLENEPPSSATPLWPGLPNVTLGDELALSDGLEVTGPLHGLLFSFTGHPPSAGRYIFGEISSWTHVGAVMFGTDNGFYERPESIGIDTHLVTPRIMEQASSALLRINHGFTGTVRSWLRTA